MDTNVVRVVIVVIKPPLLTYSSQLTDEEIRLTSHDRSLENFRS